MNARGVSSPIRRFQTRRSFWRGGLAARVTAVIAVLIGSIGFVSAGDRLATAQDEATPAPSAEAAWAVAHGANPARTRAVTEGGPVGAPTVHWTFPLGGGTTTLGAAGLTATADGVVYIDAIFGPESYGILAIEAATGTELWRSTEADGHLTIDGDGLLTRSLTPTGDGVDLLRLSRTDGRVVWRAEIGLVEPRWAPVVAGGVGYLPVGAELVAFNPATGERLWSVPLDAPASRSASVAGGVIVLGDQQGTIYGFGVADGERLWSYDVEATTIGHVALANGLAYAVANDILPGVLLALDLQTGALRWSYAAGDGILIYSATVDDQVVFAPRSDGVLTALDALTGEPRWEFAMTGPFLDVQSPTTAGETVYVHGVDANLYALDRLTGAERWRVALDDASCSNAVVAGEFVYVGSCKGTLYAIGGAGAAAPPPG